MCMKGHVENVSVLVVAAATVDTEERAQEAK